MENDTVFEDITDTPCSTEKRPQGRNPAVSFQSLLQLKPFNHALQIFSHT